jgi:hypothetical protein
MLTVSEVAASIVARQAAVDFIGIQRGMPELGIVDLVLFKDRVTHSTLALPISQLTRAAIRAKVRESRERFGL